MRDLENEIARQDVNHPTGYPANRNGIRLGIATLEDELREVWAEWNTAKHTEKWDNNLYTELIQVAAVAMRIARNLRED